MEAGSIWVRLGLDSVNLETGLVNSNAKIQEFSSNAKTTTGNVSALGDALNSTYLKFGLVAGATGLFVTKIGGLAQELGDLSIQTGISTEKLQRLQYTALLSGTSTGSLSLALNTLTRAMGDAADTSTPAYKAFMGLGVDPRGRTPDEVFDDLAKALYSMDDPAQKAAVMQDIFGKNYREMIPYITTYVEKQKEIESHPIWTEKERQSMEDSKVAWDEMVGSITLYSGKLLTVIHDTQEYLNLINPFVNFSKGKGFNVDAENVASFLTGGASNKSGELPAPFKSSITININNPKGTAAENAAALVQASRDLYRGMQ